MFRRTMIITFIIIITLVIGLLIFLNQPQFGQPPSEAILGKIAKPINYRNGTFKNKHGITVNMNFFKALSLIPKWMNGEGEKVPSHTIPIMKRKKEEFENLNSKLTRITWFGHSAFLVEIEGKRIMLDPMLGNSPSPVSFFSKRFNGTLPLDINDIPPLDAIILSHDHYDHLDYQTILRLKGRTKHFYTPLGVGSHLKKWGISQDKITELDWWDEIEFMGMNIACTPAQHFSGRGLGDRNKTLWCSWVIKGKNKRIFFSGDSGYSDSFKEIGEKYGPFDICLMECGQYNELWKEIHMMPEQTVTAHIDLKGKILMPMHWGAFSLSMHKWYEPIERLLKAAQSKNITVTTPMIGESIILGEELPDKRWWNR